MLRYFLWLLRNTKQTASSDTEIIPYKAKEDMQKLAVAGV